MKIIRKFFVPFLLGVIFSICMLYIVDSSRFHQILGGWGRKLGYYSFAVEHFSRAIHLNGTRASAFNSRGVSNYHQGRFELAVEDYTRAIELDPQFALAIKNRALVLLTLGKAEDAKRDYSLACNLGCCEDFTHLCSVLKLRCEEGECANLQAAVKVGLCLAE